MSSTISINLRIQNSSQTYHFDQVLDSTEVEKLESCPATQPLYSQITPEFTSNVAKVGLATLLAGVCAFQRENVTNLLGNAFDYFCGDYGVTAPILMSSAYLALKYMDYSSQKTEEENATSYTSRAYNWLKSIPSNFALGASYLPQNLALGITTSIISINLLKSFGVDTASNPKYEAALYKASLFDIAIKGPFLEELFFRELLQGSSISIMKLINSARLREDKDIAFTDETISKASRIFSAVIFGMVHSNQSIVQAACAGISAYAFETWLYEKNGLFASFGLHCANNLFAGLLLQAIKANLPTNDTTFSNATAGS